jgi:hypothetical protein
MTMRNKLIAILAIFANLAFLGYVAEDHLVCVN